jgi:hypothetical protein
VTQDPTRVGVAVTEDQARAGVAVTQEKRPPADECPFPGPASYDYDGRRSFVGREDETVVFAQTLLGRQLTILTAGSGDGKTSLLHAGLAPMLFRDGLELSIAEPGGDAPIAAIGQLCMQRLLPPRAEGRQLIERLIAEEAIGPNATLEAARAHVQTLDRPARQMLLGAKEAHRPVNLLEGGPLVTWLRDEGLPAEPLAAAMNATAVLDGLNWPGVDVPLSDLRDYFAAPEPLPGLVLDEDSEQGVARLLEAMDAAIGLRCAANPDFELVFVIDQFEEIFVQYRGGPGARGGQQRWRHREALLELVRQIRARPWPVRVVLALRKEHYADLQAALGERAGLAPLTHHLGPLNQEQAQRCLLRKDIWRRGPPSSDQAEAIIEGLRVEDQYVHPTLLSVVGEWLWRQPDLTVLSNERLRAASSGAIEAFVKRALETGALRYNWTAAEQQEALDILSQLIIVENDQARRLSVAWSTILDAPFRDRDLRERLLNQLQERRLLRIEFRLGGFYVEIIHERLIEAIHAYMGRFRERSDLYASLSKLVEDLRADAPRLNPTPLDQSQRNVLLANVERLSLPSVIAARTLGRLLLDPGLGRGIADAEDNGDAAGQAEGERLRGAIRTLAVTAAVDDVDKLPKDPDDRMREGLFASPSEVETLLASRTERIQPSWVRLMLASALLHRDPGAETRIRLLAQRFSTKVEA